MADLLVELRDAPLRRAVAALGKKAIRLEILGSFPASTPAE